MRITNGTFDDVRSLYSRIIVAAGGSGSAFGSYGSPGGDINGYQAKSATLNDVIVSTTSQTDGNKLGIGENGYQNTYTPSSGSGGGYYGGKAAPGGESSKYQSVSSSGSSFISGYPNCDAVDEHGAHTNSPVHYSGLVFENAKMLNGMKSFLSPEGENEVGHKGDGAIRITLIKDYVCVSLGRRCPSSGFLMMFVCIVLISY